MYQTVKTYALVGLQPVQIRVEASIRRGTPMLLIVGLAAGAARECRERIRAAASRAGLRLPGLRITVNLAPADLPKTGASYDLPILVAALAAAGHFPASSLHGHAFLGELGLDGSIRPVRGILAVCLGCACDSELDTIVVPMANLPEASGAKGIHVLGADSLSSVVDYLTTGASLSVAPGRRRSKRRSELPDLSDVQGQEGAKRVLEIAAAGGHHLLLLGEPGAGKTMLASRLPGLLPPLSQAEAVEVTVAHSVVGLLDPGAVLIGNPPFRSPHHTVTTAGLIGGGSPMRPGEVSLAHRGVLFLDELGEFRPTVLEALRQPLETGQVRIVRDRGAITLPGRFQLVAAMNGCPCGFAASVSGRCICDPWIIRRYLRRLSGPLLDRIDMTYEVPAHRWRAESDGSESATSAEVRLRVASARRFGRRRGKLSRNAELGMADLRTFCRLDDECGSILAESARRFGLSTRSCHQVQRVARTIADLASVPEIRAADVSEALTYRRRLGSLSGTR
ncbi:MAG: ATP-binding protein [Gemmatimonadales bacterium]|nr:MAG: ATP-binding protein [Gemmatimonadales bacterium]